jgi:hypothetical protein
MNKLPNEIVYQIVAKMENCRDILNFCITNSQNKEMCQRDSVYLIRKAIERKYPNFPIKNFLLQIKDDIVKAPLDSPLFGYLNGNGVYQKEFDQMPESQISNFNKFKWSEIKENLLYISKCLQTDELIKLERIIPFSNSMWGFKLTPFHSMGEHTHIFTTLSSYISSPTKRLFEGLKEYNFDILIDALIRFNKHRWNFDYTRFNQPQFKFTGYVDFNVERNGDRYLITILCKILKGESIIKLNLKKTVSEYLEEQKNKNNVISDSDGDSDGDLSSRYRSDSERSDSDSDSDSDLSSSNY